MSEWRTAPLGDFVTFQRGVDITRAGQTPGAIPVVSSGGVSSYHSEAIASGPGVVIGRKGTLGKAFYIVGPYWPHDTTLWVRDFKGNDPRFVYYFMSKFDVSWLDAGSANPTLNRNHLHPIEVTWPGASEQQAIAEVLGALDDKIAANTALATSAESLAIAEVGKLGSAVPLAELVDLMKDQLDPRALGKVDVDHFSLPAFDADALPAIEAASSIKSAKFAVTERVVLLSKLNPRFPRIWRAAPGDGRLALASTEFLVLKPRTITTELLWAALAQPSFSEELDSRVAGTSGSHQRVRPADALTVPIKDPRLLSQHSQAGVDAMLRLATTAREENRTLAATRDALLPQLMSGKLRVRDREAAASDSGI